MPSLNIFNMIQWSIWRHINKSSDTCTTIWDNFDDNFHFLSSHWSKTIERERERNKKRKRENKNIMWVWDRKLSKSCNKVVVQISFFYKQSHFILKNIITHVFLIVDTTLDHCKQYLMMSTFWISFWNSV